MKFKIHQSVKFIPGLSNSTNSGRRLDDPINLETDDGFVEFERPFQEKKLKPIDEFKFNIAISKRGAYTKMYEQAR